MERRLIEQSILFHGTALLDLIADEHGRRNVPPSLNVLRGTGDDGPLANHIDIPAIRQPSNVMIGSKAFVGSLRSFIAQKADLIFQAQPAENAKLYALPSEYDFMPPLESFMGLKCPLLSQEQFFQDVEPGDLFCCSISGVSDEGLSLCLLCYANRKSREIDHLRIPAFCSIRCLPRLLGHSNPEDVYNVKDKVRGVVINLNRNTCRIQISLLDQDLPTELSGKLKLGLIGSDDLPSAYHTMCKSDRLSYGGILSGFSPSRCPGAVHALCEELYLPETSGHGSLIRQVVSAAVPRDETAVSLRKQQSRHHALQNVMEGVKLHKVGKHAEAAIFYNRALDADPENVEALVARGAMYANNESYRRALDDFRLALKICPQHQNAVDYMVQTLMAYAKDLRDAGDENQAISCCHQVLALMPAHQGALLALSKLRRSSKDQDFSGQEPDITSTVDRVDAEHCWETTPHRLQRRSTNERGFTFDPAENISQCATPNRSTGRRSAEPRSRSRGLDYCGTDTSVLQVGASAERKGSTRDNSPQDTSSKYHHRRRESRCSLSDFGKELSTTERPRHSSADDHRDSSSDRGSLQKQPTSKSVSDLTVVGPSSMLKCDDNKTSKRCKQALNNSSTAFLPYCLSVDPADVKSRSQKSDREPLDKVVVRSTPGKREVLLGDSTSERQNKRSGDMKINTLSKSANRKRKPYHSRSGSSSDISEDPLSSKFRHKTPNRKRIRHDSSTSSSTGTCDARSSRTKKHRSSHKKTQRHEAIRNLSEKLHTNKKESTGHSQAKVILTDEPKPVHKEGTRTEIQNKSVVPSETKAKKEENEKKLQEMENFLAMLKQRNKK